jgi:hypothetical protein
MVRDGEIFALFAAFALVSKLNFPFSGSLWDKMGNMGLIWENPVPSAPSLDSPRTSALSDGQHILQVGENARKCSEIRRICASGSSPEHFIVLLAGPVSSAQLFEAELSRPDF